MGRQTKILVNKIKCKKCGDVIESKHVHDFVECTCFKNSGGKEGCAVDGGHSYLKRCFEYPNVYEDLSETRPFTDREQEEYENRLYGFYHDEYDPTVYI